MFGDMRLSQPPYRRCEAGDALEPLNRRDAGGLGLPIAKADLFDHIQALDVFIALEYELNERMFFGLWPGCRVHRQHQKLGLGDDRCQRMQELHPSWPRRDLGKQYRVHRRCSSERDRKPKYRAQDHEQCGVRSEMSAFSEHPCHATFKGTVHSMFERPVANLPPEPPPISADRSPPVSTFRLGKGKEAQRAFMAVTMTLPRTRAAKSGSQTICIAKGKA